MKTNFNMNPFAGSDAPQRKAAGPWNPGHQNVRAPYLRKTGAISMAEQPALNEHVWLALQRRIRRVSEALVALRRSVENKHAIVLCAGGAQ